jgi:hypothetical protein
MTVLIFSAPSFVNGVKGGNWRRVFPRFCIFKMATDERSLLCKSVPIGVI